MGSTMTKRFTSEIMTVLKAFALGSAMTVTAITVTHAAPAVVTEGKLAIGSDLTYPPFAYMSEGKPAGFDVEMMNAISKAMALEPAYVDTRFASLINGLRSTQFDLIASALYITTERQKVVDFIPYIYAGSSIITLSGSDKKPVKAEDLCGLRVGNIKGASWIPKLNAVSEEYCKPQNLPAIELLEFDTDAGTSQALKSRAIDAQFMDGMVALELLEKFPADYTITSSELLYPIMVGIAVNPNNTELYSAVAEGFEKVRASGEFEALLNKYKLQAVSDEDINSFVKDVQ